MAKVLLVEDDNNLREIYQARLLAEGYDIVAAQNGEEALVVAKQNKPDLIISDVMMPRISGFEMLDILRNTDELKHTKVIMLTALGQSEDQKRANNLGADKYLVKSQVTLEDIVNAAKELLAEDGVIADVPPPPAIETPTPAVEEPVAAPMPAPITASGPVAVQVEPGSVPAPVSTAVPAAPQPAAAVPSAPADPTPVATMPVNPVPSAVALPATPVTASADPASEPAAPVAPAPTPMPTPPPAPAEPTAVPAPVPAVPSTPAPAPADPTASATTAVADAASQTLEAEEAALQSQIDDYAKEPAAASAAVEPSETPATDAETSNTQAITNAVEELNTPAPAEPLQPPSIANAPTPMPTPPPAPAEPTAVPAPVPAVPPVPAPATPVVPAANDNNVVIGGKKVISPISDPATKPDFDALLAKEEAKEPAPVAPPMVNGAPASTQPMPPHTPGQSFDPNTAL